jgi:hypothetical protein
MITRGSARNEPSRALEPPNLGDHDDHGDHGENGRIPGRSSISWTRRLFVFDSLPCAFTIPASMLTHTVPGPRMVEKLLLHMHYELVRHGRAIPFD